MLHHLTVPSLPSPNGVASNFSPVTFNFVCVCTVFSFIFASTCGLRFLLCVEYGSPGNVCPRITPGCFPKVCSTCLDCSKSNETSWSWLLQLPAHSKRFFPKISVPFDFQIGNPHTKMVVLCLYSRAPRETQNWN